MTSFSLTLTFLLNLVTIQGDLLITSFIDTSIKNILICNADRNTELLDEALELSNSRNLWVEQWDCEHGQIPETGDGVILLIEIEPEDFKNILEKENIQSSLTINTWIIYSQRRSIKILDYFNEKNLRIGPNARIFFVRANDVTQVFGTGSYEVFFHVGINYQIILFPNCCI